MRIAKRLIVHLLIVVGVATGLSACGHKSVERDTVLNAIKASQQLSDKFTYTDQRPQHQVSVVGLVEDDFRFKARVTYNGNPGYDEIISDDTLAVRLADPARVANLVDPASAPKANPATDLQGITVLQALLARRWVVDPVAAPALTRGSTAEKDLGGDPVLDAVTALDYTATAVTQAAGVKKYSKDDIEPAYPSSEDPFPKPGSGSGVERYDLVRAPLPPAGAIGPGGQAATPKTSNFRKMAIYVKHKRVIKVLERVEVTGKGIGSLVSYYRTYLKNQKAGSRASASFENVVKTTPANQLGNVLLAAGNQFLEASGAQPVLIRNMSLDLLSLGAPDVKAALPGDQVVHGSLALLKAAGTKTVAGTGTSSTGSGSGGTGGSASSGPTSTTESTVSGGTSFGTQGTPTPTSTP